MLCSVLRRAGKLRTLGNCPRLWARAGADRRQVTRQSIPVIFKIYEVLSLAVVDVPVELCVTRLRYAQIHGLFSRMLARHQTAPASPSCAGSPGPAGRGRLGGPRRACGINQVSLIARIRLSLTGHHSCRAAPRGVSVSRFARAIVLRYVTQYKGRDRAVTSPPVVWPGSIGPGQIVEFHCPHQ